MLEGEGWWCGSAVWESEWVVGDGWLTRCVDVCVREIGTRMCWRWGDGVV
jgi:hypothetical protein